MSEKNEICSFARPISSGREASERKEREERGGWMAFGSAGIHLGSPFAARADHSKE